ncbi:fasciclin [Chitinophaga parva]|uniref:Fasciclin n=1 Tax=Chitinophaga parva TaxID=2169414 RepID=A0A2T7BBR8_9BACT|nr:fasciclin domain-containing protein [Chitinophaga parva]PUZ21842.1 fasciclin [Chitinophaga parva]
MQKNIWLAGFCLLLFACKKDDSKPATSGGDANQLVNVITDNKFNFSDFNTALTTTGLDKQLRGAGPYTVLIPDNTAFQAAGYSDETAVAQEDGAVLLNMVRYHLLDGSWDLNKLPFRFNQPVTSFAGTQLYITHWIKGADTVITINGTPVSAVNMPASNGLIQVISAVMPPLLQNTLSDAVAADTSLTFLNTALQVTGMKNLLAGNDAYTLFAPSNNAFRAAGYPSMDSIATTDPAVLKALLLYQLTAGRHFVYDYILTADDSNTSQQTMANSNTTTVTLVPNPQTGVGFTSIRIQGSGNPQPCNIMKQNVLTNNGILHIIDQVLKENF